MHGTTQKNTPTSCANERAILSRAMSQENIQLIRAAIDALNASDVAALNAMAAPGFEYDVSRAVAVQRRVLAR